MHWCTQALRHREPLRDGALHRGQCWAELLHDGQVLIGDDFDGVGAVGIPRVVS